MTSYGWMNEWFALHLFFLWEYLLCNFDKLQKNDSSQGLNKRAALLAHMKRHIRRKDFCCEFCNKMFPELRELKTHRKEHTGDRPYKCEKCGKGFKSQGTLRSHLGVHSGETVFTYLVASIQERNFYIRLIIWCQTQSEGWLQWISSLVSSLLKLGKLYPILSLNVIYTAVSNALSTLQ